MSRAIRASREQQFLLPPSMDDWLPTSHAVRFVADLVEELDLEGLGFHQSPGEEGRPHFAPDLLLGVWLFGWMERIRIPLTRTRPRGSPFPTGFVGDRTADKCVFQGARLLAGFASTGTSVPRASSPGVGFETASYSPGEWAAW
jgi:hypothetical protein